jgi:predicted GIY-YIG superfamily endonuclease
MTQIPDLTVYTSEIAPDGSVWECRGRFQPLIDYLSKNGFSDKDRRRQGSPNGFIYAMAVSNGTVKIGSTWTPLNRLKQHASSCKMYGPLQIREIALSRPHFSFHHTERALHKVFADRKLKGEFFRVSMNDIEEQLYKYYWEFDRNLINQGFSSYDDWAEYRRQKNIQSADQIIKMFYKNNRLNLPSSSDKPRDIRRPLNLLELLEEFEELKRLALERFSGQVGHPPESIDK